MRGKSCVVSYFARRCRNGGVFRYLRRTIRRPPRGSRRQAAKSLEAVFGKMLISIDGSTIEITAAEGRISREIVAPNGAVQRSNLVFINARLGTVADARDAARVTGVFRASDQEILIQYGDGSSEIVQPNAEGGITIETHSPKSPTYCTSWYPEGHVFSLDDRKTALLQYANRLGLGVSTEKAAGIPARSGCGSAAPSVTAASSTTSGPAASPVPAAAPTPAALATSGWPPRRWNLRVLTIRLRPRKHRSRMTAHRWCFP